MEERIKRLMKLFDGLDRFRGVWIAPKEGQIKGNYTTIQEKIEPEHWAIHLAGTGDGVGVNPIRDDSTLVFAAIDLDRHGTNDTPLEISDVAMRIEQMGWPNLVCSSKSKGSVHIYLFLAEPMPASMIQRLCRLMATALGEPKCEIFPKQTKLVRGAAGNWINMPYYGGDDGPRYCWHSNRKLTLDEFIALAESKKQTKEQIKALLASFSSGELAEAPPCVESFMTKGVGVGQRNEAMFTIATFYFKTGDSNWKERVAEINHDKTVLEKPLPPQELATLIRSVEKGGYSKYRCNQPPMCDRCDKELCKTRKFGVGPEGPEHVYNDAPNWGTLTKILTEPPRYELGINGKLIMFDSMDDLLAARRVRSLIAAGCNMLIPPMRDGDWQPILAEKMESMQEEEAPMDAGPAPIIGGMLDRFLSQAERYDEEGKPIEGDKKNVMRGKPVLISEVDKDGNSRYVIIFRAEDFIIYLKKNKAEEVKGAGLWMLMSKRFGCRHKNFRGVTSTPRQLWYRVFEPGEAMTFDVPTMEEKF